MGGGLGSAMGAVKSAVVSVFSSVKNLIAPEEDPIKSFSAAASENTAPTQVIFTVQTSKNVQGLRIVNDNGVNVYNGAYSADMESTGEVISNSNVLLWKPTCTVEDAYTGGFTAYAPVSYTHLRPSRAYSRRPGRQNYTEAARRRDRCALWDIATRTAEEGCA